MKNVHQIIGDAIFVADGFKKEFDLVFLDMKDDVEFLPKAWEILKEAGYCVVYNPYIEQTKAVYEKMKEIGFKEIEAFELVKINLEFKRVGTRPFTEIFHTGYLVFGRKV